MKKIIVSAFVLLSTLTFAQDGFKPRPVPVVDVKTLDGKTVSTSTFTNDGKPYILDFWATWCKPCVNELNAIKDVYADWQKETGVKVIAVSVDDARTATNIKPFVNGKGWEYEIYSDANGDLKRALNIGMVPYVFLVDGKGQIVSMKTGYAPGDEEELYKEVKALLKTN